jgi:hypothetical protein
VLRAPVDVDESLLYDIVLSSGMKMDSFIGQGTGFWSFKGYNGCHLLRRHFSRDYLTF